MRSRELRDLHHTTELLQGRAAFTDKLGGPCVAVSPEPVKHLTEIQLHSDGDTPLVCQVQ